MLPLIYGKDGDNYLIVASKGGDPKHPEPTGRFRSSYWSGSDHRCSFSLAVI
jgi:hypothetical protein